jgi:hypothetical protein
MMVLPVPTRRPLLAPLALVALLVAAAPPARAGQSGEAPAVEAEARSTGVRAYLDGFLGRATVAARAATLVREADEHRRRAAEALAAGRRGEARAQFRRASEAIAAAAPEGDDRLDDPFLRLYLGELTSALAELERPALDGFPAAGIAPRSRWRGGLALSHGRLTGYRPMMERIFREEGVPAWLISVGLVESSYNPGALSPKGALGIWQFMPATGDRYGLRLTALGDERQHPEKSTRAAARYLSDLYTLFGDWELALAAYNAGEGRVARVMRRTGVRAFREMAARGLLPAETIQYVPAVLAAAGAIGAFGSGPVGESQTWAASGP